MTRVLVLRPPARRGPAVRRGGLNQAGAAWAALSSVVVVAWVAIALGGGDASPVTTTAAGAAAAAGTAALVGAGWRATSLGTLQTGGVLVLVLPAAAAGAVGGSTALLALSLVLLAAVEVAVAVAARPTGFGRSGPDAADVPDGRPPATRRRRHSRRGPSRVRPVIEGLALAGGCALLAAGLLAQRLDAEGWVLPDRVGAAFGLAFLGAAVVVATAALGPPRAWPVAVAAMAVLLPLSARLPVGAGVAAAGVLAVAFAAGAATRPTGALAALAVAAAASSADLGAAAPLLAAAAVLALAVDHRGAALLGLPGAAALAAAVVPPGRSGSAVLVAAAAVATALVLALRATAPAPGRLSFPRPPVEAAPAFALGAWLLLAPGTWAWTGADDDAPYDRGAAVAAAAALLAAVASATRSHPARTAPATVRRTARPSSAPPADLTAAVESERRDLAVEVDPPDFAAHVTPQAPADLTTAQGGAEPPDEVTPAGPEPPAHVTAPVDPEPPPDVGAPAEPELAELAAPAAAEPASRPPVDIAESAEPPATPAPVRNLDGPVVVAVPPRRPGRLRQPPARPGSPADG